MTAFTQASKTTKTTPHRETLSAKVRSFIARWVTTPSDAAAILSERAKTIKTKSERLHDQLRAELAAGYVGGKLVR